MVWSAFFHALEQRSPGETMLLGLLLVVLIGFLDQLTGYELSFSIFYLLPIILVSHRCPAWMAVLFSVISAGVWLLVDVAAGHIYGHIAIAFWNAVVRLSFFLIIALFVIDLKKRLLREEYLSKTDSLTQLYNARAFKEISQHLLQLAIRNSHPVAIAYIDLDNFKAINDNSGHSEGDRALQQVAHVLADTIRATDVASRLGGDEFVILMPETGYETAQVVFERIHKQLMTVSAGRGWPLGFSIGVAVFEQAPTTIDEALKVADRLMYRVKHTGKNSVVCQLQPAA